MEDQEANKPTDWAAAEALRITEKFEQACKTFLLAYQRSQVVLEAKKRGEASDEDVHQSNTELAIAMIPMRDAHSSYQDMDASPADIYEMLMSWGFGLQPGSQQKKRLRIFPERYEVEVDGKLCPPVGEELMKIVEVLYAAKGDWVTGKTLGKRPDKTIKRADPSVKVIIETDRRHGYRIKPVYFG